MNVDAVIQAAPTLKDAINIVGDRFKLPDDIRRNNDIHNQTRADRAE